MAALLMVVLGNFGTIRMVYQGFEEMAAPGGNISQCEHSSTNSLGSGRIGQSSDGPASSAMGAAIGIGIRAASSRPDLATRSPNFHSLHSSTATCTRI